MVFTTAFHLQDRSWNFGRVELIKADQFLDLQAYSSIIIL